MIKDTTLTYLQQQYAKYWNKENHDRPLLALTAPDIAGRSRTTFPPPAGSFEEQWLDFNRVIARARTGIASTRYLGEAYPCLSPNLGPDILGAILGCELRFGAETSWAVHTSAELAQQSDLIFDENNCWWQRIYDLTTRTTADAAGEYIVGVTDLHTGLDALVSLYSPQNLCYDLVDRPVLVEKFIWQIFEVFKEVYERLYAIVSLNQQGASTNWMNVFHPGRWYVTSCDFICMLSPADFRRFVLPELTAELDFLDASLFHLDGPGALRHLDDLLALAKLDGIQWVPGAGAAPAREWIPVLQRIQKAGKLIQMTITPEDYIPIVNALDPEGVMFSCACDSVEQAEQMLAYKK